MKLPLAAIVVLATLALVTPAALEAQAPAPTAEQRTRAREAYTRGQQLFDAGQFEQAQVAFEEAYAQVPNPVVLLGVASAQERRGLRAEARATLERYLRENPNARDRAQIEARIAALPAPTATTASGTGTSTTGTSTTGTSTTGTSTTGTATTGTATTASGTGTTAASTTSATTTTAATTETESTETETEATEAEAEATATESTETQTEATDAEASETEASETEAAASDEVPTPAGPSTAVWVLTAVGAVGLVAGTVFGFMALSRQSDFDAAPTLTAADEGEAFALVADISFGVALAGGIAAIVLYATEGSGTTSESSSAGLRLLPTVTPQGGGLVALGRF